MKEIKRTLENKPTRTNAKAYYTDYSRSIPVSLHPIQHLQQTVGNQAVQRLMSNESTLAREEAQINQSCMPAPGIPNSNCSIYASNAWWLPLAYVNNATCACQATPNEPTANCVRKFLQDRLAATPWWLKALAASYKSMEANPFTYSSYQVFVQAFLTRRIYQDHVDAYRSCCCPSGPAPYYDWIVVTSVPIPSCDLVGLTIKQFGSCHGTPGAW